MNAKFSSSFVLQFVLLVAGSSLMSTAIAQDVTTETSAQTSALPAETTTDTAMPLESAAPSDASTMPMEQSVTDTTMADSTSMDSSSVANSDAAANAASAAEASTANAHSQYGLEALWEQGDVIARGTLVIMILMSAATWYVLVTKLIQQQGLLAQAKATRKFWEKKEINESLKTYRDDSAFRAVAEDGVLAAKQHAARTGEKVELGEWVALQLQRSVERVSGQLQNGLSLLATVGSCSPFVGLFGTVWGIYHALIAIGLAGQASIDKVAGPVGEALIMTAIGLAVAVPAVLGYNWLVRRNKVIVDSLRNFAGDMHANLVMGVRGGQSN